jgi:sRNA-binding regulator protein Hfq
MNCSAEYLEKCKQDKTEVKVFLENKTMLVGKITSYDDVSFVLKKSSPNHKGCLVFIDKTISIDIDQQ